MADDKGKVPEPSDPATPEPYKRLEFATKEDADEHYNTVFAERDSRMRKTLRQEITDELAERFGMDDIDEVVAVFEEAQAMTQGDETDASKEKKRADRAEKAVEKRDKTIEELNARVAELEKSDKRVGDLEERLRGQIKPKLEQVPELYRTFVEAMDVETQAEWFEQNAEKLGGAAERPEGEALGQDNDLTQRPAGQPPTGRPAAGGPDKEKDREAKNEQLATGVSRI